MCRRNPRSSSHDFEPFGAFFDDIGLDAVRCLVSVLVLGIGPWKSMASVEWETLKWVDWFNNRRLLAPIGYIPPAEAEERYYAQFDTLDMVA